MIVAQITDTHVKAPGSTLFGGLDTGALLAACIAEINATKPRPDVVLLTGDLVNHGRPEEYAVLRPILDALAVPLFMIPGNHDDRDAMRAAFPHHRYLGQEGFIHYAIEDFPVRLIGLDTLVPGEDNGAVCAERLAWLDRRLGAAPSRPTIVFMHHPPFTTGIAHSDRSMCAGGEELGALIGRHPQIERVLCGHVHRPIQTRWNGSIASTAPSTAFQFALDLDPAMPARRSDEPPAFQIHYWYQGGIVSHLRTFDRPAG